ncbi:MAG: hypothetical protein HYV32_01845 [Candidatus Kerfeldbacteria bacterium]|nr:hypothetical protein [Candidatus Kerfeldbacteria bacterium]
MNAYIFLGPTFAHYRKALECDIWFRGSVTAEDQKRIELLIPYPLSLNLKWGECFLHCATDDIFEMRVREKYGNFLRAISSAFFGFTVRANEKELERFSLALSHALDIIHTIHPILFFLQPKEDGECKDKQKFSNWHEENVSKIRTEIVPALIHFFVSKETSNQDKAQGAWIVNNLFSYIPLNIEKEYIDELIKLVKCSLGHDKYIDRYNHDILDKLIKRVKE